MNIRIVTPAPRGSRYGNRVTAQRWARLLRELGHRVVIAGEYKRAQCDVLIALHARRSARSIARFHRLHPERPLVLCLTGTDLYKDIRRSRSAQRSLELATRMVTLQPLGEQELPEHLRPKVRTILQSVRATPGVPPPRESTFDVCVVAHLRPVKDPFRATMASRLLPASSRLRVLQVGGAMSAAMEARAQAEEARNPRFRWLGELPRWGTRRTIARSRALVLSSVLEGGANVVSEAVVEGTPVLASHIAGSVGLLGEDYPGYFPVGDTRALARLLHRIESEPDFLRELREWCVGLAARFHPDREREAWASLLREIAPESIA